MSKLDYKHTYNQHVAQLSADHDRDRAMELAIGGQFEAYGLLERDLLISCGLEPEHYLIDIGCGSGRLAHPLSAYLTGPYLGTDVVPELLSYARELCNRPEWRFELIDSIAIPAPDSVADMVCFFSVFTHLLHEESFVYLQEAQRVLKPGGKVVFSFLEFAIPCHWDIFSGNIANVNNKDVHLNMFMSRDGIQAWVDHLDLEIVQISDGDKPHFPIQQPVTVGDGSIMEGMGNLGQSVCVLQKPS